MHVQRIREEIVAMIGFYDYTVILTYIGALAGLASVVLSMEGSFLSAILCIGLALFCDTTDGMVARAKKGRSVPEMMFGIQIDSLCDVISFGVAPAGMFYALGLNSGLDMVLLGAYVLCCVIRLAYFNILAGMGELGKKGDYHGLPVVCLAVMVPALFLLHIMVPQAMSLWVLRLGMAVFGFLYILDFKVKKPNMWKLLAMVLVFWVPVAILAMVI